MLKNIYRFFIFTAVYFIVIPYADGAENVQSINQNENQHSPYQVLKLVSTRLFNRIYENKNSLEKFPELMETIVEKELLPAIDYRFISYKILGKHLKNSTREQRTKFVQAMKNNIVRSYATILKQYTGQQLIYVHQKPLTSKNLVAIPIEIVRPNKPTIELQFKLRKHKKSGKWLIFDMLVKGVSMLSSKQAQISSAIQNIGLEQITMELR